MAFNSRSYRVLIASPADLPEERQIATDAIASAFLDVLGATETFLKETCSMPLKVIASP